MPLTSVPFIKKLLFIHHRSLVSVWDPIVHWGREGVLQIAEEESVEIGKHVSDRH